MERRVPSEDAALVVEAERYLYAGMLQGDALSRRNGGFPEIEHPLLRALAPLIPEKQAVDIGAYRGAYTDLFLSLGFKVTTCEPVPSLMQELHKRYRTEPRVTLVNAAIGEKDGRTEFLLARLGEAAPEGTDPNLFNSLVQHPTQGMLDFQAKLVTPARSLSSLIRWGLVDREIGILKIDTEGHDLTVLDNAEGMLGRVTLCEFWNRNYVFAGPNTPNDASDYRTFLRNLSGDYRTIVLSRDDVSGKMFFHVDVDATIPGSWGNILITRDEKVFAAALNWCIGAFGAAGIAI